MIQVYDDSYFMKLALEEAKKAMQSGEIPIGGVLVAGHQLISRAHNQTELLSDVTAHAEIMCITAASQYLQSKYLKECTLYITLEPCPMCAGALRWAQLGRLVYAAEDLKMGYMRYGSGMLHPATKVEYGLKEQESSELLKQFFKIRREIQSLKKKTN